MHVKCMPYEMFIKLFFNELIEKSKEYPKKDYFHANNIN